MYRWLFPFPRLVQTEYPWSLGPRAVKEDLRVQPGPWSQMARPTLLPLTMVAADAFKPTKSLRGARPKEMTVTTGEPLRVAVPVQDKSTRDRKHGSGDPLGRRKQSI